MRTVYAFLFAWAPLAAAAIDRVVVDLPPDIDWVQVMNQETSDGYQREWIPSGTSVENTDWLIVEQKFQAPKRTTANRFLKTIMRLVRRACTDVTFNGPEKIVVDGHRTWHARAFCAQQHGKPYGTVTDWRVIAEGKTLYVATSELRTPPTPVAGMFSFKGDETIGAFMHKIEKSAAVVRESVRIIAQEP